MADIVDPRLRALDPRHKVTHHEFSTAKFAERISGSKRSQTRIAPVEVGQAAPFAMNGSRELIADTSASNRDIVERLDKTNELLAALLEIMGSEF